MKKSPLDKIIQIIREDVPTNAMAHGKIAGSAEAGDDPPVRKKKKNFAYGGHGSRRVWLDYFKKQNGRAN
jgi:hypothetical protein|tara:strand:- start:207 stop:416 length:210 start_codon:yes stop_codon:yes gene_type:complete